MAMRTRREVRRLARESASPAILVEVHPQVAATLFRDGAGWVRAVEESSGKQVRVRGREGLHIERLNVAEAETLKELEALPAAGGKRTQFWMDREPGEVLSLADPDPAYEMALAMAAGPEHQEGFIERVRRLFRGTRDGGKAN
jgi:hypothetical protein